MTVVRVLRSTFAVIALTTCLAAAQTSGPSLAFRQPLDDAWWTGPLLAPNASTLPQGHVLIEPYLYDVITEGFYNSRGTRVSAPHENGYGSLTYINYGLVNKFTVGVIPTFGYNEPGNGLGSAGVGVGDLMVQAQYRLHLFHEGGWLPTTSVNVQETLPTGRYDQLDRPSDGFGAGAYTTTLGLYTQTFFWMPTGRICAPASTLHRRSPTQSMCWMRVSTARLKDFVAMPAPVPPCPLILPPSTTRPAIGYSSWKAFTGTSTTRT